MKMKIVFKRIGKNLRRIHFIQLKSVCRLTSRKRINALRTASHENEGKLKWL
jgi:hypothetical protein